VCIINKTNKLNKSPKTSEGSQFHQPPQVPSCNAHQLPKKSAKILNISINLTLTFISLLVLFSKKWSQLPKTLKTGLKNKLKKSITLT
jgi:hypothetical protein